MLRPIRGRRQQRGTRAGVPSRCEGGQSLLEFALTFPLLIILLLAMIVVAWVGFSYFSISSGARQGTRWMLNYPQSPTAPIDPSYPSVDEEIKDHVRQAMPMLNISDEITEIIIEPAPAARVTDMVVSVTINHTVNLPTIRIPYVIADGGLTLSQPLTLQVRSRMILE